MKILVIQLARIGDIYMSWPILRALKRKYQSAQIHILTRPRFEGALEGLDVIDKHHSLTGSYIMEPLVANQPNIASSIGRVGEVLDSLQSEEFDMIINLTFSPVSSFITHLLSHRTTKVFGYSRFSDGTLCLPDEVSAYFYAQVGINRPNRIHITDIFASMLDIQYVDSDWQAPTIESFQVALPERYVVLHVGASEEHKTVSAASWASILRQSYQKGMHFPIVLIGGPHEAFIAIEIQRICPELEIINLVGKTKISEVFAVLQEAELLIGCDSSPIHMASLTNTPTLNVSLGNVNFWETGPKASLGFVYRIKSEKDLRTEELGNTIFELLSGNVRANLIVRTPGIVSFSHIEKNAEKFQWDLVQSIYLGTAYPIAEKLSIVQAAIQLKELNEFAIEQIDLVPTKGLLIVAPFLDQVDELMGKIGEQVPDLQPLIWWYQAEKVRIGPGSVTEICHATKEIHLRFLSLIHAYVPDEALLKEGVLDGAL